MINQSLTFDSSLKKFGLIYVNEESMLSVNSKEFSDYIKVLYVPRGYEITVDFTTYKTKKPSLFFIAPNQYFQMDTCGIQQGFMVFYNRDFYCIQIHDHEVACDGLLFNNIHNMPMITVDEQQNDIINLVFQQIEDEFTLNEQGLEEMTRTYLKQLLIRATRMWKKQNLHLNAPDQKNDVEYFRKFTVLVDKHYKEKHTVADYAELLHASPKTITHKFKRWGLPQPNEVIKNRLMLEAKRLLVHSELTVKEIGYSLGYEDPAYFSRLFLLKTGESPARFRNKYHTE